MVKDGFETEAMASIFVYHAYVEALHVDGSVLGRSSTVKTKVPKPGAALQRAPLLSDFRLERVIWVGIV